MKAKKFPLIVALLVLLSGLATFFFLRTRINSQPKTVANTQVSAPESIAVNTTLSEDQPITADGFQEVRIDLGRRSYERFTVKVGIPVRLIVQADAKTINGCNNSIIIPEYGLQSDNFVPGDNIIEFTPTKTGTFPYSCWMGMIRSSFEVIE